MERAPDAAVLDRAADPEVRAEVRAERVLEVERPGLVAPEHELTAEVPQRGHATRLEVLGRGDLVPGVRDGEREARHPKSRTRSYSVCKPRRPPRPARDDRSTGPGDAGEHAAVDDELRAGAVRALVGREEHDHLRDLVGFADPSERRERREVRARVEAEHLLRRSSASRSRPGGPS